MAAFDGEPPFSPVLGTSILDAVGQHASGTGKDCFPVDRIVELAASIDSANYYSERMTDASIHRDKYSLLDEALATRTSDGMIVEFGVFEGATINFIADRTREQVFGFDCFEGLPEDWRPGFPRGTF